MAGQSDRTELLAAILLATLLAVIVTTDATEDFHVSYDVSVNPSVNHQLVIEYEPLTRHRYRRQAAGNVSTVPPTPVISNASTPDATVASTNVPETPAATPASTLAPTTPAPTSPATTPTTPSPTTTPTTARPSTTQPVIDTTQTARSGTGSTVTPSLREDNHQYYSSSIIPDAITSNWMDLTNAKRHKTLSTSHRTAVTINLTFKFRFYGHNVTNITVATGGFIYASPFLHQWLTATQYIAPLMANFDTRIGEASDIYYDDFGDKFAVQWKNVVLKDQNETGTFDFQVQLQADGTIKFLYKQLPIKLSAISSSNHPVKIGVSDAFYIDSYLKAQGIRRRTIYEYHRVSFHPDQVEQGTVIVMKPLPTCNIISDCKKCVNHDFEQVKFDCKWCGSLGRCSDGIDWHRAEWLNSGCSKLALNSTAQCDATTTTTTTTTTPTTTPSPTTTTPTPSPTTTATVPPTTTPSSTTTASAPANARHSSADCGGNNTEGLCKNPNNFPVGAVVAIVILLLVVFVGVGVWVFYAYTHPTSASGMWLMEHRPSQMKEKIANIKFWKSSTPTGTKYQVESEA
ncbi:plexin domain-containing protein 2-like isoform X2 [Haliotis rufescens]|uniref:plexin domain-containing protein 2-like isoform X2 n=1 Tax=Haliotis rufescens TaxID=6454 RepID=UPI00201F47F2|nr:plexin domain-containing protein 2-like isoform X2 [Haliotis rufescens]